MFSSIKRWLYFTAFIYIATFLLDGAELGLNENLLSYRNSLYLSLVLFVFSLINRNFRYQVNNFNETTNTFSPTEIIRFEKFIIFFFLASYLKLNLYNYMSFNVVDVDFSFMDLMIANFVRGKSWFSEACNCNHFGVHSTYIFFLISPLHKLFDTPLFLVFLHGLILWSAIFPLRKILIHFKIPDIHRLLLVFTFFNYTRIIFILNYNFHYEVFYVPFFFWIFYAYLKEKWSLFHLFSFACLLVKEDAGFYLIGLSAATFLFKSRKNAIILFIYSLAITIISLKIVIPFYKESTEYVLTTTSSKYGSSIGSAIFGMLSNPASLIQDILTGQWIKLLIPALFLPLFDFWFLIATAPFVVIHSISSSEVMKKLMLYYSAPFLPFVWFSFIKIIYLDVIKWEKLNLLVKNNKFRFLVFFSLYSSLVGSGFINYPKINPDYYRFVDFVEQIPKNSRLCVQGSIFPHMAYDFKLTPLKSCLDDQNQEFFIINPTINTYPYDPIFINSFSEKMSSNKNFLKIEIGNFYIFKKIL